MSSTNPYTPVYAVGNPGLPYIVFPESPDQFTVCEAPDIYKRLSVLLADLDLGEY